jgi:5'-3' exonuclease
VHEKFGVAPRLIPDFLALVGDSADGYPGIPGIGRVSAARLVNTHGPIESFPSSALAGDRRELALLFKDLATLRDEAEVLAGVDDLRWRGPVSGWPAWAERLGDERLAERCRAAQARTSPE